YFDFLDPPITSVRQKKDDLGNISISLLLNSLRGNISYEKKRITVPTELIVRRSVRKL
ncbi:MAG: substrate-binding domain-containing protein, partial [Candidatus Marinimicrobia bacterium]|nr:substrate-binding domain-containing protein [Candidatus Neomarinimicrobiota bacterium]